MTIPVKIKIRAFRPNDEKDVIQLWKECGLVFPQNDPRKDIRRKLKVQADLFLVAVYGKIMIGTVVGGYEGHRGWINYLAVSPNFQRKGVGRSLMGEIEKLLKKVGCPKINLQVRESNKTVMRFYEKSGYVQDKVASFGKRLVVDDHSVKN